MELERIGRQGAPFEVLAICTNRGDCPVLDFLSGMDSSDAHLRNRMLSFLRERVAKGGPPRNREVCRALENGICEFKKGPVRIFWFWDDGQLIICTHAYRKKSRKAPRREIEKAKLLREQYEDAKRKNALIVRESQEEGHGQP
ncbi:MAG: type II toxin-antitoxin system RelE/ParE family toxin [Acidobacteriota bacterium]|jgi:phage-related protein